MKILAISGSAGKVSSNVAFLKAVQESFQDSYSIEVFDQIREFPLFRPEDRKNPPKNIIAFKEKIQSSDALIIATPEYSHNIPAALKNVFEWCTASGEFHYKKTLPITFTPIEPRGEYAMESMIFTLQTLESKIATKMPLYKSDVEFQDGRCLLPDEVKMMLEEGLKLL